MYGPNPFFPASVVWHELHWFANTVFPADSVAGCRHLPAE